MFNVKLYTTGETFKRLIDRSRKRISVGGHSIDQDLHMSRLSNHDYAAAAHSTGTGLVANKIHSRQSSAAD